MFVCFILPVFLTRTNPDKSELSVQTILDVPQEPNWAIIANGTQRNEAIPLTISAIAITEAKKQSHQAILISR